MKQEEQIRAIQEARDKDIEIKKLTEIAKYRKLDNFFAAPNRMPIAVTQNSKYSWAPTEASLIQDKVI